MKCHKVRSREPAFFVEGEGIMKKFMVPSYRLVQCCGSIPLIYGSGPLSHKRVENKVFLTTIA